MARRAAFDYGFATEADDAGLRALLRETPVGGAVRLSFEREPNYFESVRREGRRHYTICAREDGKIVAMASRTVWPTGVGYLHQLRVAPSHRHRMREFLRTGFRMLRETHAADEAPYDVTTIVSDNHTARRLLEAGLPGLPRYTPVENIVTMLLPVRGRARPPGAPMTDADEPAARPYPAVDFRPHKQVVVRGYDSIFARWVVRLPVGSVLPIAYASSDGGEVPTDCRWVVVGLPASHPSLPEMRRKYRPREYESILYVVHEPGRKPVAGDVRWEVAWL